MIARYRERLDVIAGRSWFEVQGTVEAVRGLAVHVRHLPAPVGSRVLIAGSTTMRGEVVGFDADVAIVMLDDAVDGVVPGCTVRTDADAGMVPVGPGLIGRVLDGLGRPIDGRGPLRDIDACSLHSAPLDPMEV